MSLRSSILLLKKLLQLPILFMRSYKIKKQDLQQKRQNSSPSERKITLVKFIMLLISKMLQK